MTPTPVVPPDRLCRLWAKTPAPAAHVETSQRNCAPWSRIVLRARCSIPCWRIVFSTFRGCMSFYTARVKLGRPVMSAARPLFPRKRTFIRDLAMSHSCQTRTLARLFDHLVGARDQGRWDGNADGPRSLYIDDQLE